MKKKNSIQKKITPNVTSHHVKTAHRLSHGLLVGALIGVTAVGALRYASRVYAAQGSAYCVVSSQAVSGGQGASRSFIVKGNTATTTFTVSGKDNCVAVVSLASWQAPYGSTDFTPYKQQKLLYKKTESFTPGTHTMSIQLGTDCYYQADLIRGSSPTAPDGTADYEVPQLIDYVQGGTKVCEPPKEPAAPTAPATPTTPAAPQPTPSTLVNTGPGAIIIIGLMAIVTSYIFYIRRHIKHHGR